MKTYYKRHLPHILPPGETVFITFRLYGSLPVDVIERLSKEKQTANATADQQFSHDPNARANAYNDNNKRYFGRFDELLDRHSSGQVWLKQPKIATIVKEAIQYHHQRDYVLRAYCIMANHVHLLVTIPDTDKSFIAVMKSLKGVSARRCNALLQRTGAPFWQSESYDHVVRNDTEYKNVIAYILNNPVRAGLVENWEDWPHSYWEEQ